MLLGLSTGHEVGLALVAGTFIAFALVSALVIPRRWPQFPGYRLGWFVFATLVLFVATLSAVEVFAKEPAEPKAAEVGKEPQAPPAPAPSKGKPAVGKAVFASQSCGSCHALSAAGSTGGVGPNLDDALKRKDAAFVRESIVDPNKEIAKGFQPNIMPKDFGQKLTPKQIDGLVAFVLKR